MKSIIKCQQCSAEMQQGFLVEHKRPLRWIAGQPRTSIFFGTKSQGEHRRIESYRCVECGYLESYAREVIG